jgi:hypothetical protein
MSNLTDLISQAVVADAATESTGGDNADAELLDNLDIPEDVEELDDDVANSEPDDIDPLDEDNDGDDEDEADDEDAEESTDQDNFTVTVDGEEIQVSLDELRNGYMRQAKFTRSQQALAEERRQVEAQREELASFVTAVAESPFEFVSEVVQTAPTQVVADYVAEAEDPTEFALKLIATLHRRNVLLPELSKVFTDAGVDLDRVAVLAAKEAKETGREKAKREAEELAQRESEEKAAQDVQAQAVARFEREWENVKDDFDLSFSSTEDEEAAIAELVDFCVARNTTDLAAAWQKLSEKKAREAEKLAQRKAARAARASAQQPSAGRSSGGRLAEPDESASRSIFAKPKDQDPLRSAIYAAIKTPK